MRNKPLHIGNVVLALDRDPIDPRVQLFMGLKPPKNTADRLRTRARIGCGCWTPIGGGNESYDRTPRHAARRETRQESGDVWNLPLAHFKKVAVLETFTTDDASWEDARPVWRVYVYTVVVPCDQVDSFRLCPEYEKVAWHPVYRLPWDAMIPSDRSWIPRIFRGERFIARLLYRGEAGGRLVGSDIIPRSF